MQVVETFVKFTTKHKREASVNAPVGAKDSAVAFSFGARRYISKGPRRLFLTQKCFVSPTFEPEVARPNSLLHLRSNCA